MVHTGFSRLTALVVALGAASFGVPARAIEPGQWISPFLAPYRCPADIVESLTRNIPRRETARRILRRDPVLAEHIQRNLLHRGTDLRSFSAADLYAHPDLRSEFVTRSGRAAHIQVTEGDAVRHIHFHNLDEPEERQWNIFLAYLRMGGTRDLPAHSLGAAVTISRTGEDSRTWWALDLSRFSRAGEAARDPAIAALPADVRDYFARIYQEKLLGDKAGFGATREMIDEAKRISEQVADRSLVFVRTRETPAGARSLRHFDIDGTLIAVRAEAGELLPMELKNPALSAALARLKAEGPLVEIGRRAARGRPGEQMSPRLFQETIAAITGFKDSRYVVAEVDAERLQGLWEYGFEVVHTYRNAAGKKEFVVAVTPREFFARAARLNASN